MNNKEKQIEEIHKMAQIALGKQITMECTKYAIEEGFFDNFIALYNAGYRKIPENSIIISKDDYKRTVEIDVVCEIAFRRLDIERNARKEAIKAFVENLKNKASSYNFGDKITINNALFIEDIDNTAKDFGIKTATRKNKKKQPNFENHTSEPDWN